jgi:hypothetical protein
MTIKDICETAGVCKQSYYNWKKGKATFVGPRIEEAIEQLTNKEHGNED